MVCLWLCHSQISDFLAAIALNVIVKLCNLNSMKNGSHKFKEKDDKKQHVIVFHVFLCVS